MYGKMKKKKEGGSMSEGMMEDYTKTPIMDENAPKPKRKPKVPPKTVKKAKGGKIGRGCGAAMRGAGKVMKP